jgi:hypothetical protein
MYTEGRGEFCRHLREGLVMLKLSFAGQAGLFVLLIAGLEGCNKTGSLQVSLSPPAAVDAGAQWSVDGGAWRDSGATVSNSNSRSS